jgi:nucleoside-diphosphate-sugar epimerase
VVDATLHLWGVRHGDGAAGKSQRGVFNYVDMPDMTVAELDRFIYHELGRRPPSFRLPLAFGMAAAWPFDVLASITGWNLPVTQARVAKLNTPTRFSAAKVHATGFQPRITLVEGLRRTIHAMNEATK